jgi:hypothetical protein
MPIENRNLEPGTKLIATYKKETYHALVVASTEGKVLYQLSPYDGRWMERRPLPSSYRQPERPTKRSASWKT